MKTTLKVLGVVVAANLLSNIGLQAIKKSGVGLAYDVTGRLGKAARFALTPAPIMMAIDDQLQVDARRRLRV